MEWKARKNVANSEPVSLIGHAVQVRLKGVCPFTANLNPGFCPYPAFDAAQAGMPSRLNKRQQRELEEISALARPSSQIVESSDEEQNLPSKVTVGMGFTAVRSVDAEMCIPALIYGRSSLRQRMFLRAQAKIRPVPRNLAK